MNTAQRDRQVLTRLYWLRGIAFLSQLIVLALVVWGLAIQINILPLLMITFTLGSINIIIFWRLKQTWNVSKFEIAINLTIDVLILAALLYFSGGSSNPLVSLFIIPVALSAVFLPVIYIIWMVLLTISLYTLLMEWSIPLPSMGSKFGGDFNLHIIGMYGNFIFSAIIIAIFIYVLAYAGRRYEQKLALHREKMIRSKHVVETGLMAANAAHKINTPLSTIGLLAEELLEIGTSEIQKNETVAAIVEIQQQVSYCKKQLEVLQQQASSAHNTSNQTSQDAILEQGIMNSVQQWIDAQTDIQVQFDMSLHSQTSFKPLHILLHTLINLMDNAAHASRKAGNHDIRVTVRHLDRYLIIDVDDFGDGLSEQQLAWLGKQPYTSKQEGMGIGLLLSHSSLDQLGGHIILQNHPKQMGRTGIKARISLPLETI